MKVTICDICDSNEANIHLKIKMLKSYYSMDEPPIKRWERIDICENCFNEIIRKSKQENKK